MSASDLTNSCRQAVFALGLVNDAAAHVSNLGYFIGVAPRRDGAIATSDCNRQLPGKWDAETQVFTTT
jgi:hypothetical protein